MQSACPRCTSRWRANLRQWQFKLAAQRRGVRRRRATVNQTRVKGHKINLQVYMAVRAGAGARSDGTTTPEQTNRHNQKATVTANALPPAIAIALVFTTKSRACTPASVREEEASVSASGAEGVADEEAPGSSSCELWSELELELAVDNRNALPSAASSTPSTDLVPGAPGCCWYPTKSLPSYATERRTSMAG